MQILGGTLSVVASHVTNLVFGDKVDKEEGEERITMSVSAIAIASHCGPVPL